MSNKLSFTCSSFKDLASRYVLYFWLAKPKPKSKSGILVYVNLWKNCRSWKYFYTNFKMIIKVEALLRQCSMWKMNNERKSETCTHHEVCWNTALLFQKNRFELCPLILRWRVLSRSNSKGTSLLKTVWSKKKTKPFGASIAYILQNYAGSFSLRCGPASAGRCTAACCLRCNCACDWKEPAETGSPAAWSCAEVSCDLKTQKN